jgi:hypothetical protein
MSESLGISITTHTDTCCEYPVTSNIMHLYTSEERVDSCINCYEDKEGRDDNIAHEIVDEGNMQYHKQWLRITEPSGHDWISSTTRVEPYFVYATQTWEDTREEYKLPIVQLQDGGEYEELWELEDYTQRMREVQCKWCNILTPKKFNDCQVCDKPLEHNLV